MNYVNFVTSCFQHYREKIPLETCDKSCQACFDKEFRGQNTGNDYACTTGGYYYAVRYSNTYISEIYHLLEEIKIIEKIPFLVNIASLGGGMGTDFLAIEKYIMDYQLNLPISCTIFDKAAMWENIIALYDYNNIINFNICDLTRGPLPLSNYDLVFINKLISTLSANKSLDVFLQLLPSSISSIRNGSFLIFNDVNSCYKGRDRFLSFMSQRHEFKLLGKFYYDVRGAYKEADYIPIKNTDYVYSISQLPFEISDLIVPITQAFFAVYKKEG